MAFEQLITSSNYPFTYEIPKLNLDPNKKIDDPKNFTRVYGSKCWWNL